MAVFRVTVVYYVCSDTQEHAEEETAKCCCGLYDSLRAEKVHTISSASIHTGLPDWLTTKVYKGKEQEVQF